jgi:hypothetical protein
VRLLFPEGLPKQAYRAWKFIQQLPKDADYVAQRQALVDKFGWSPQVAGGCLARIKAYGL